MADEFDKASEFEQLLLDSLLYMQSKKPKEEAAATGQCLYCEEPLPVGLRWCDSDCRDDWEYEQKRNPL